MSELLKDAADDDDDGEGGGAYTSTDVSNAYKFAQTNVVIKQIRLLHKKYPHLTSYLSYRIEDATNNDYYIPPRLKDFCKVVHVGISERLCQKLSCNPYKEKALCTPNDVTEWYRVGDGNQFDLQCQPACFNLDPNAKEKGADAADLPAKVDKKPSINPQMEYLIYNHHVNKCRIAPSFGVAFMEKPFYRSEVKYVKRVNDLPTGFSRVPATHSLTFGTGLDYAINKSYCSYFNEKLTEEGECDKALWRKYGIDLIGGSGISNAVASFSQILFTGTDLPEPSGLPPKPSKSSIVPWLASVSGWKNDINSQFVIPNIIQVPHQDPQEGKDISSRANYKPIPPDSPIANLDSPNESEQEKQNKLLQFLITLLQQATNSAEFWKDVAIQLTADILLAEMIKAFPKVFAKFSTRMAVLIVERGTMIGARVLGTVVRMGTAKLVAQTIAKKSIGWIIPGINIVLAGLFFAEIGLTLWDPYQYGNMMPASWPHETFMQFEKSFRESMGVIEPNFEFEHLVRRLLTSEELSSIELESMYDLATYLEALTVNSEGSLLNKGYRIPLYKLNGSNINLESYFESSMDLQRQPMSLTVNEFDAYNQPFLNRCSMYTLVTKSALAVVIIACLLIWIFPLLALVLLVSALSIWSIAQADFLHGFYDSTSSSSANNYNNNNNNSPRESLRRKSQQQQPHHRTTLQNMAKNAETVVRKFYEQVLRYSNK